MSSGRAITLLLALLVFITVAPSAFAGHGVLQITSAAAERLHLEISYRLDPHNQPICLTEAQAEAEALRHISVKPDHNRQIKTVAVLTGSYYHTETNWPGGLLIIPRMHVYQRPSPYPNRPVIAQLTNGRIAFLTNTRAWQLRTQLRVAMEVGPFLLVNRRPWNDFTGFADDPYFLPPTIRRLIGQRANGQLIFVKTFGTLGAIRDQLRRQLPDLVTLVNLDGGSSAASPTTALPTRLVIFECIDEPPQPTPIPISSPSPSVESITKYFSPLLTP